MLAPYTGLVGLKTEEKTVEVIEVKWKERRKYIINEWTGER